MYHQPHLPSREPCFPRWETYTPLQPPQLAPPSQSRSTHFAPGPNLVKPPDPSLHATSSIPSIAGVTHPAPKPSLTSHTNTTPTSRLRAGSNCYALVQAPVSSQLHTIISNFQAQPDSHNLYTGPLYDVHIRHKTNRKKSTCKITRKIQII